MTKYNKHIENCVKSFVHTRCLVVFLSTRILHSVIVDLFSISLIGGGRCRRLVSLSFHAGFAYFLLQFEVEEKFPIVVSVLSGYV